MRHIAIGKYSKKGGIERRFKPHLGVKVKQKEEETKNEKKNN